LVTTLNLDYTSLLTMVWFQCWLNWCITVSPENSAKQLRKEWRPSWL